jgi:uncharacterized SAM-binding protein YcdF (DUF218 family)
MTATRSQRRWGVRGRRRWALLAAVAVALWPLAAWAAAEALVVSSGPTRADALVVLAGSSTYRERARRAAELYREGRAPLIILTNDGQSGGWSADEQRNPLFVERAAAELQRGGVPAERIEVVGEIVTSTYEEAVRVREFAERRGLRSVLAVAGAYQSRRALWTLRRVFRESGIEVGVEAAPTGDESPRPAFWWCRRLGWALVPGEYFKLAYYRVHYG